MIKGDRGLVGKWASVLGHHSDASRRQSKASRCAALVAKIEKLSQTVRPSLGWDKDSKCGPSSLRQPMLGGDAPDHLDNALTA
jgi:hypothetical protein